MAFTETEKLNIRRFLGYPPVTHLYANPRLESAINLVEANATAVNLVRGILADIADVDTKIRDMALVSAGVKSLDTNAGGGGVELYQDNQQTKGMQMVGREHCARLSHFFGVPIANDYFGPNGYSGDAWKANNARNWAPRLG